MAGRKPDSPEQRTPGIAINRAKKLREILFTALRPDPADHVVKLARFEARDIRITFAERIHVLPEERHLAYAASHQARDVVDNLAY